MNNTRKFENTKITPVAVFFSTDEVQVSKIQYNIILKWLFINLPILGWEKGRVQKKLGTI